MVLIVTSLATNCLISSSVTLDPSVRTMKATGISPARSSFSLVEKHIRKIFRIQPMIEFLATC
jgi:hypothetical protein